MKSKIVFLTALCALVSLPLLAQHKKGTLALGGEFAMGGSNNFEQFTLNTDPTVGYFLADNWEVGSRLSFGYWRGRGTGHQTSLGLSAYTRKYFNISERTKVFLHGGVGRQRNTLAGSDFSSLDYQTNLSLGVGVETMLTKNVALTGGVYQQWMTIPGHDWSSVVTSRIGLRFYLPTGGNKVRRKSVLKD